jgi:hypothetical protein
MDEFANLVRWCMMWKKYILDIDFQSNEMPRNGPFLPLATYFRYENLQHHLVNWDIHVDPSDKPMQSKSEFPGVAHPHC